MVNREVAALSKTSLRHGFTLIELLVVIAIIAILAAILMPVFIAARENARQVKCISNVSQISKALRLYADDHDGKLAGSHFCKGDNSEGDNINWNGGYLLRYIKTTKIYLCLSDRGKPPLQLIGGSTPATGNYPISYSINSEVKDWNLEKLKRPARILLIMHESRSTINDCSFKWWSIDRQTNIHKGGAVASYCDLHTVWKHWNVLEAERVSEAWNPDVTLPGDP